MLSAAVASLGGPPANGMWKQLLEGAVPGRSAKQMRERWRNNLDPELKTTEWTEDENTMLVKKHDLYGSRWTYIAMEISGGLR